MCFSSETFVRVSICSSPISRDTLARLFARIKLYVSSNGRVQLSRISIPAKYKHATLFTLGKKSILVGLELAFTRPCSLARWRASVSMNY